jgi:asparagine synthase (glutamine-hydrolysing)
MCGIVAISSPERSKFPLDRCLYAIQHRGPDGRGVYISPSGDGHLGHVRLSILDLSTAGHQPMADTTGRFVISYNGEVYNYRELRSALEARHGAISWKSGTDTEVIVEGFAREGIRFLDRLNGIFALAIYDTEERRLHVLRDPLGIKPLFITAQKGSMYFCSELKGLLAIPSLERTLRRESLAEQLAFMYVPEPHTLYYEFKKLQPGICFTYQEGSLLSSKPLFVHLRAVENVNTEADAVEALQQAFAAAVKRQMIADVPVSLFLSGGLDSSAVAFQAVHSGANVKDAYTIAFTSNDRKHDAQSDDQYYAELMARRLGLELKVITASRNFLSLLPELSRFMEDGFSDPAAINTYLICAGARNDGVKVMLSGQGADEYLGGYRRYLAEKMLSGFPALLQFPLSILNKVLPERMPGRFNALNRRIKRLAHLAQQSPRNRMLGMYSWMSPEAINNLFVEPIGSDVGGEFLELFDSHTDRDILDAMMELDQYYDLMSLNLCYTDRMSMAVGVETRVPFLDFDLVRVMNSISAGLKVKGKQGKYVLKKAMEPHLPREVIYRGKAGFGLPIRAWMNNSNDLLAHYLDKARIEGQGIFNASALEQMLKEQFSGSKDHSHALLTLLTQQLWLESNNIN